MLTSFQRICPKDEVIRFCLDIAEENIRCAEDPSLQPKTIAEIAAWFCRLMGGAGQA